MAGNLASAANHCLWLSPVAVSSRLSSSKCANCPFFADSAPCWLLLLDSCFAKVHHIGSAGHYLQEVTQCVGYTSCF